MPTVFLLLLTKFSQTDLLVFHLIFLGNVRMIFNLSIHFYDFYVREKHIIDEKELG